MRLMKLELRYIIAIYSVILVYVSIFDFVLSCKLINNPELEVNMIARAFMENGILPFNLIIPSIVIFIIIFLMIDMKYTVLIYADTDSLFTKDFYYSNNPIIFILSMFFLVIFISGHIIGLISWFPKGI